MKRFLCILLFLLASFSSMMASDEEKLCIAITKHQFAKALKVLEKMDSIPEDAQVMIGDLEAFIEYTQQYSLSYDTYVKLYRWYASHCVMMGDLMSLTEQAIDEAEYYYHTAAKVYATLDGDTSQLNLNVLEQLSQLYAQHNKIPEALNVTKERMRITELLGDTIRTLSILNELGILYYRRGDNPASDSIFSLCDNGYRQILDSSTSDYIILQITEVRALMYSTNRDFNRALSSYYLLKTLYKKLGGKNELAYAAWDIYIGLILLSQNKVEEADPYVVSSYEAFQRNISEQSLSYYILAATTYSRLCFVEQKYDEWEKTLIAVVDQAKEINAGLFSGEGNPQHLFILDELAVVNIMKNDYEKALEYLNLCASYYEAYQELGIYQYEYANNLYQQMIVLSMFGDISAAYSKAPKSYNMLRAITKQNLLFLSSEQRTEYWEKNQYRFSNEYPDFYYKCVSYIDTIGCNIYDNLLFYKGILLQSTTAIQDNILNSGDHELIRLWNELQRIESAIIHPNSSAPINKDILKRRDDIDKYLTNKSQEYVKEKCLYDISWRNVRNVLEDPDIAIEFSSFNLYREHYSDSVMYCAIMISKDCEYPKVIPLFEEKKVIALVNTTTENLTSYTYSYNGNGNQLSQLVWSKILPYIKQGETIYFAPSGILHQLAIEALPYDESHTMGDMFNLMRLSSTREIVTRKDEFRQSSTATLYGGIQYNMDADELLAESEAYKATDLLASRGIESDTLNRGTITYLKGTKAEAENINTMLKQNNLQVQLFTAKNANEESFKALSGKHRNILHIATHGFYWSDSTAQKKDYFSQRMLRMNSDMPSLPTIDPLNRCGLLFAGAQTAWSGHSADLPEGVQDGILTAKEISLLDLRDADLVVLSACETGKGEITGDGVFGLQRAFKQAGVQTIIMSLWPVNDAATQLLMTEFYRNWITNHQSKREAFKNAQNTVRSQYSEPVYWAGFIMLD